MKCLKGFALFIILFVIISSSQTLAKETIYIEDGLLVEGRTLVPMRTIFEHLGAKVKWDGTNKTITATQNNLSVKMKIDSQEVILNGEPIYLDVPPQIRAGKTLVPLRFISDVFGASIKWDTENSQATLTTNEKELIIHAEPEIITITISAAGDVTLGRDASYGYQGSFDHEAKISGLGHFVKNIKDLFSKDDLTMVNLEGPLTTHTIKKDKQFAFKGDPSYVEILTMGNIDAVNLANNHTFDYFQKGYEDTMKHLKNAGVGYFGYENHLIKEIKGVKVGLLGYTGWSDTPTLRNQIKKDINSLKNKGVQIILVNFHWGVERSYVPNQTQKSLGRFTIDSGADLVVGHHPHVIQGIEEYKGKFIVYSLGNFMFGGNRNPSDKDTFVFQQTFHVKGNKLTDKKEIKVIPFSISSVSHRNNFQPTPLTGKAADNLKAKIVSLSKQISPKDWTQYEN